MYNQLKREPGFPVTEYGGHKWILISTRTVVGGKNPFMGIAYVVVGGTCVLLGALFTIAHLIRPRYAFCLLSLLLSWFFLSFFLLASSFKGAADMIQETRRPYLFDLEYRRKLCCSVRERSKIRGQCPLI